MSIKSSSHQRHDSGELDVFEAARYFSGAPEISAPRNFSHPKTMRGGRISLDIPIPAQTHHHHYHNVMEKPTMEKKLKQPNSPGGKLANFLNSLFSQSSSKKKKSKSSTQSMKDEDDSPGGRRKRRSSISHFRSVKTDFSNNSADSKSSIYSSSSTASGFRTPPPYANTPTKNSYKDFRSYSDHKPVILTTLSKINGHVKSSASQKEVCNYHDNKKMSTAKAWSDEEFKFSTTNGLSSEKFKNFGSGVLDQNPSDRFRKFINEVDDGADSDSSSDLFELPNYDLGCGYSSGLPVYETTHMDSIKIGAPITS